jgi:pyridoxal biosynthesis lyase PdxS
LHRYTAVTHYNDPKILAEVSQDLGDAMVGLHKLNQVDPPIA